MKLVRERLESACRIPVGLAVLLAGCLLALALVFVAFGQRYQIAGASLMLGDGRALAYRLDRMSGDVVACLTVPEVDAAGRVARFSVDCSGAYR